MQVSVIYFNETAPAKASVLAALPNTEFQLYDYRKSGVKEFVRESFYNSDALVFIGAAAIAVRLIAPYLQNKAVDPAVIVVDELGSFVIPILSGHLGGANALAQQIAAETGAIAVITTATDVHGKFAVDVWAKQAGCEICEIGNIKHISAAILRGEAVGFYSDFVITGELPKGLVQASGPQKGICVCLQETTQPFPLTLHVVPKILTLGIGCKKGVSLQALEAFVGATLAEYGISMHAVRAVASVDLKNEEAALLSFCRNHALPFETFSAADLALAEGAFNGSEFVQKSIGVDNVCERAAVLSAKGSLLYPKRAQNGITLAIAAPQWQCLF